MRLPVYEAVERVQLATLAFAAVLLTGCGLQGSSQRGPVAVTVTKNYGREHVASGPVTLPSSGGSAYSVTGRRFKVAGGPGSVSSIAGTATGAGRRWFLYIDGVAARPRARVYAGERVWWDLHASGARAQAVVGSFPQPFLLGQGGQRLPTTVACGRGVATACKRVTSTLTRLGVPVASQLLGAGSGQDSLTVEVAPWQQLTGQVVALLLAKGPALSGVYARFDGGGTSLELLDDAGASAGALGHSSGLIAAIAQGGGPPTWLITGTDAEGVVAAADALDAARLRDRFALAVSGGRYLPVPR